jgi:hypothetical protein
MTGRPRPVSPWRFWNLRDRRMNNSFPKGQQSVILADTMLFAESDGGMHNARVMAIVGDKSLWRSLTTELLTFS